MKLKFLPILGAMMLSACTSPAVGSEYNLTAKINQKYNNQTAYLVNYDNGEKLDSTTVKNGSALFIGKIDKPLIARVIVNGKRFGNLILEGGTLTFDSGKVTGSGLNDALQKALSKADQMEQQAAKLPADSAGTVAMQVLKKRYDAYCDSVIATNADNPIGYFFFLNRAYELDLPALKQMLEKLPSMKGYTRTTRLVAALEQKQKTQPGCKFLDFSIPTDSTAVRLSDYVGKGRYTLVDFWASWCGPCIRETRVLKQIREEFKEKPLDILGVAVWDEPKDTEAAIKRLQLPWPQIINAQSMPTDLYGISGIPCIILFGPDGTILSRDLQGEELIESVRSHLEPKAETPAAADSIPN